MADFHQSSNGVEDPDALLVMELKKRTPGAYEKLLRTHGGRLLRVARRLLRSEDDARDCVQETFIQVFKRIEEFQGRSSLQSWLHRITVNFALMKIRSQRRLQEDSIDDLLPEYDQDGHRIEPESGFVASLDGELEAKQTGDIVRRAIDRLPDNYRTVLLLRDIEDYTTHEAAAALGIDEGAVKTRLHRARAALKTLLQPLLTEHAQ